MRDFDKTAEPAGPAPDPDGDGPADQNRFVIQHHLATRLHHDLRLERGGTLRSWALPKGLPLVPRLTHLAMQTEDHPLDYLTFDGEIPEGEYGGGQMRIWDTGTYSVLEWEDGKVTVKLDGIRHQGEWHLFRLNRRGPGGVPTGNPKEWMITRATSDTQLLPADPPTVRPSLASPGGEPFDHPDWLYEIKWDGVRAIATVTRPGRGPKEANSGTTVLRSRNGNDITPAYPELWPLWERVLAFNAVLDGEVVALDAQGRPSFSRLQHRMHLRDRDRVDAARARNPVQLVVFDLLALDGQLLTRAAVDGTTCAARRRARSRSGHHPQRTGP